MQFSESKNYCICLAQANFHPIQTQKRSLKASQIKEHFQALSKLIHQPEEVIKPKEKKPIETFASDKSLNQLKRPVKGESKKLLIRAPSSQHLGNTQALNFLLICDKFS